MNFPKRLEEEKGYIVESGSKEDASYIKFGDGTMICTQNSIRCSSSNPYVEVTFPVQFIIEPNIILTNRFSNSQAILWSVGNPRKNNFRAYAYRIDNNTYEAVAAYIAIRSLEINIKSLLKIRKKERGKVK